MKTKLALWAFVFLLSIATATAQFNGSILEQNYNLTPIMSVGNDSAIDDPPQWIANWNIAMGNIGVISILYVFSVLLFMVIRRRPEVKDSEALLYAGLVGTVLGVMLFVIEITNNPTYKLVEWALLLPIIVITAFAIFLNMVNRNY